MKLLVLSDIHANLTALEAVLAHAAANYGSDFPIAHLGDAIDYGMRPNETLGRLAELSGRMVVNLAGNHERAALGLDAERFSSGRGVAASKYTGSILEPRWFEYLEAEMSSSPMEMDLAGRRILFVHGNLEDPFWGKMTAPQMAREAYRGYDYVICGHTHLPFLSEAYADRERAQVGRDKVKTTFINYGSVGQPRNWNPAAQYGFLDLATGAVHFNAVPYDVQAEEALFSGEVDPFYAERLKTGV